MILFIVEFLWSCSSRILMINCLLAKVIIITRPWYYIYTDLDVTFVLNLVSHCIYHVLVCQSISCTGNWLCYRRHSQRHLRIHHHHHHCHHRHHLQWTFTVSLTTAGIFQKIPTPPSVHTCPELSCRSCQRGTTLGWRRRSLRPTGWPNAEKTAHWKRPHQPNVPCSTALTASWGTLARWRANQVIVTFRCIRMS